MNEIAAIPMRLVGPIKIVGISTQTENLTVPLATYETPLWPSVTRGARVSQETDGILTTLIDERMTRSILVEADSAAIILSTLKNLETRREEIAQIIEQSSRFARLIDWHYQCVGNLLYFRLELSTGDAAGHNMVTKAADHVLQWMLKTYPTLRYVSISGNICTDKKVSAINGILGRGKNVIAEITIPRNACERLLKTTPDALINLHIKKNLLGSILSGGIRTANAHVANMLLGCYLATGQDAANLVEGSQAIVHTELHHDDLYFSVTLPHLIVGTVGNGKELSFVQNNLKHLGCLESRAVGENARRLARIIAATVLCGELSLLAAQTNPHELMRSHLILERRTKTKKDPL
ncbi:MAG: hydroxymethylglutaryl-CoA reductase [Gammaproteobacteria bacterium GWE2_42_36]|nr:MAG: hydroxymethylglutaryl-CoA reductase [Gammaproteobacteria bacterium GWE2_42_36]HCU05685.1 hydroxymethylglutaryl-CoA reductase [Coxiellaceae bacterium]